MVFVGEKCEVQWSLVKRSEARRLVVAVVDAVLAAVVVLELREDLTSEYLALPSVFWIL
jgi:hypothetical protein